MAKDPAILFYTADFITGTLTMTNEHVGMYIRLLCLQHQKGRLSEKDMLYICTSYVDEVFCKFEKDNDGYYCNKRLQEEALRRKLYSESRRKNVSKRYATYVEHMETETETETETITKDKYKGKAPRFTPPTLEEIKSYFSEIGLGNEEADKFHDFYISKGWMVGKNKMKDWESAGRNWKRKGANYGANKGNGHRSSQRVKPPEGKYND